MIQNITVNNLTGREIPFDLVQILESAPHFAKTAPNTWEMRSYVTISVTDTVSLETYAFHPIAGTPVEEMRLFAVEQAMKNLSIEASYLYQCSAVLEWSMKNRELSVILRPSANGARCVQLGRYYRTNNRKEPVDWLVLEETGGEALLLSEFALHTDGYWMGYPGQAYQDNGKGLIWEYSDFRKWLNADFCRTIFSEEESALLLDTVIQTCDDAPEETLHNKIFLLSREQVLRLLPAAKERVAAPTQFAVYGGAYQHNRRCSWWILPYREDFGGTMYPQAVLPDGEIQYHSRNVAHRDWCIRPAIRIPSRLLDRLPAGFHPARKEEQEFRIPLDGESLYFLRLFLQDNRIDRASIDKEEANDSHYSLTAAALKRLEFVLAGVCGAGDLVQLLRKYFRTHSDYDLVRLMSRNGIPYASFHY